MLVHDNNLCRRLKTHRVWTWKDTIFNFEKDFFLILGINLLILQNKLRDLLVGGAIVFFLLIRPSKNRKFSIRVHFMWKSVVASVKFCFQTLSSAQTWLHLDVCHVARQSEKVAGLTL